MSSIHLINVPSLPAYWLRAGDKTSIPSGKYNFDFISAPNALLFVDVEMMLPPKMSSDLLFSLIPLFRRPLPSWRPEL